MKPLASPSSLSASPTLVRGGREAACLIFTMVLGVVAILIEAQGHILSTLLPNNECRYLYLLATIAPIYTYWALQRTSASPAMPKAIKRFLLSVALAGNLLSLLVAAIFGVIMLPLVPMALLLCLIGGIGLFGLAPYFLLGITLYQAFRMRIVLRANALSLPRTAWFAAIATLLSTAFIFFVRPFVSGVLLAEVLRPDLTNAQTKPAVDRLHRFGGDEALLYVCYDSALPYWQELGIVFSEQERIYQNPYIPDAERTRQLDQARQRYRLMTGKGYREARLPYPLDYDWLQSLISPARKQI